MQGLGWVIFDPNWHRIGVRAFPRYCNFRDRQCDGTLRFEAEDQDGNFVQVSILLSQGSREYLAGAIQDWLPKETNNDRQE